jgi:beta-glucanase (GH16 family)
MAGVVLLDGNEGELIRRLFLAALLGTSIAFSGTSFAQDVVILDRLKADFTTKRGLKHWTISDGWTNGNVVDTDWRKSQVRFADNSLRLVLQRDPTTSTGYASGEILTRPRFRYGYFEASLKAAKGDGIVTGFFSYVGPVHHELWNEIDVEILGRDTRRAQLTYHVDGKDSGGVTVDLPFDAAQSFHVFGFDWQPNYIRWYVDGHLMLTEDGHKLALPSLPQEIVFDLWNGIGVDAWLKPFRWQDRPIIAAIRCVSYRPRYSGISDCSHATVSE